MNLRRYISTHVAALTVVIVVLLCAVTAVAGQAPALQPTGGTFIAHHSTNQTTAVQQRLASFGYSIAVDGVYGPQTTRIVTMWQQSNGLVPDGIAGPITRASLGLTGSTATAPATPAAGYSHQNPDVQRWFPEFIAAGWNADQWPKVSCIIQRESRGIPTAYNGVGRDNSYGLMQMNMLAHRNWVGAQVGWDFDRLFDARTNLAMAKQLYDRDGWNPWRAQRGAC